jgi:hypothetical protein
MNRGSAGQHTNPNHDPNLLRETHTTTHHLTSSHTNTDKSSNTLSKSNSISSSFIRTFHFSTFHSYSIFSTNRNSNRHPILRSLSHYGTNQKHATYLCSDRTQWRLFRVSPLSPSLSLSLFFVS